MPLRYLEPTVYETNSDTILSECRGQVGILPVGIRVTLSGLVIPQCSQARPPSQWCVYHGSKVDWANRNLATRINSN
jgi:hypothetical protein